MLNWKKTKRKKIYVCKKTHTAKYKYKDEPVKNNGEKREKPVTRVAAAYTLSIILRCTDFNVRSIDLDSLEPIFFAFVCILG